MRNNQCCGALISQGWQFPGTQMPSLCSGWHKAGLEKNPESPLQPGTMLFQVRVPGLGELGVVCLLAAQWVCTSPPFGYLTNTGSPKGFWQSSQSFLSESQTALPFSFTCKQKAIVRKLLSQRADGCTVYSELQLPTGLRPINFLTWDVRNGNEQSYS